MDIRPIIEAVRAGRLRITDHADEEATADHLTLRDIYDTLVSGEIIEEYPADKPYPSCLVYGRTSAGDPVHSVWAYNELAGAAEAIMIPFEKCPICGGELIEKTVDKLLRGGIHTASLNVRAEVCLHCGERLSSEETIRRFEDIRTKLERHDTADFEPIGTAFQVR